LTFQSFDFERTRWRLFQSFDFERTWWRLFQSFDFECTWWRLFWVYLMKVILSVPDEGYFEHTWWRLFWAYLMKVILIVPDEGYFEHTWWRLFQSFDFECTWWRLFQKRVVRPKFDIYVFIISLNLSSNDNPRQICIQFFENNSRKIFICEKLNNGCQMMAISKMAR
jgi:hypothetical protein